MTLDIEVENLTLRYEDVTALVDLTLAQRRLGLLLIPVGLLMLGVVEFAVGDGLGPMPFGVVRRALRPLAAIDAGSLAGAAAIGIGVIAAGGALTWAVIRDMAVRNKPA